MSGIQFVTDEKGRKVGVVIDLRKHAQFGKTSGAVLCLNRAQRKRVFVTSSTEPAA
ncbi:MAG TPA: hypothetical protein VNV82_24120 [Bryobacteraceae bacterium]|jgi:hypothetical protein|nr:hypothetical protein [Bryobacteraceae bacterium]